MHDIHKICSDQSTDMLQKLSKMATSRRTEVESYENVISSISVQFFEMVPLRRIRWQNDGVTSDLLDEAVQRQLLHSTVKSDLCRQYPPSVSYQKAFVKKLLQMLEEYGVDICDEMYEAYTDLIQKDESEESLCYKTYTTGPDSRVTLQESVNMISFGTTGLSTWQAAQHLAEWCIQNESRFEGSNVIELGSGLGLTGVTVCQQCRINTYTFTDCHSQVLNLLATNIQLNFSPVQSPVEMSDSCSESCQFVTGLCSNKQCPKQSGSLTDNTSASGVDVSEGTWAEDSELSESLQLLDSESIHDESPDSVNEPSDLNYDSDLRLSSRFWQMVEGCDMRVFRAKEGVRVASMDWENVDARLMEQLTEVDIVLAADVVFDKRVIPSLVTVLKSLLSQKPGCSCAYLASTIRNEDTRDEFLIALSAEGLQYQQEEGPSLHLFHYDTTVPIEILKITLAGPS